MNPFGSEEMADGYAKSRPPVHERVLERVFRRLGRDQPFRVALDVGCGAGVSIRALSGFAERSIGLEPMHAMLMRAFRTAPSAVFIGGRAEAIPVRDHSVDLITAAGSLNYADLDLFFPEAARVLGRDGILVVYDFAPGRSFRGTGTLDEWFQVFYSRYPPPANEARSLSPEMLASLDCGFRVSSQEQFEIGIPLSRGFYVDYMITETNVAAALRRGIRQSEIRSWCSETLSGIWDGGEREVLFRGYFAVMTSV